MKQKSLLLVILGILIISTFLVGAESQEELWSKPPKVIADAPTIWEKIVNFFRQQETFTIVGQDRLCDIEPKYKSGSISGISQTSYQERGLFLGYWSFSPGTVGGNSETYTSNFCPSGHGLYDVYCQTNPLAPLGDVGTPRFEMKDSFYFTCTSACAKCNVELYCCPQDCGEGDSCPSGQTCTTKTATDPYMPLKDAFTGTNLNSYQYCKQTTSGCTGSKTCWRVGASNTCEDATYSCTYSTYDTIVSTNCAEGAGSFIYGSESTCKANLCTPKTCAQLGKTCGSWSDGCGKTLNCGTCETGKSCISGNCVDAETLACGDGTCSWDEWLLGNCIKDCERDLVGKVSILNLKYGAVDGSALSVLTPGEVIKVNFDVKAEVPWLYNPYLVEAGLIPLSTAKKWGMDTEFGGYSIITPFVIGESEFDACCKGQPNVADNKYEFKTWVSDTKVQSFSYTLQVPDKNTKDLCGSETYWDDSSREYVLYIVVKNGCYKDGFRKNVFLTKPVEVDINSTSSVGQPCEDDFDCLEGEVCEDIVGDWSTQKYCVKKEGGISTNLKYILIIGGVVLSLLFLSNNKKNKNGILFSIIGGGLIYFNSTITVCSGWQKINPLCWGSSLITHSLLLGVGIVFLVSGIIEIINPGGIKRIFNKFV